MSIKPIICIPDPVLRQISKPVERLDDNIQTLLDDMLETMYDAPGIGLAAIQIGVPLRIVTIDVAQRRKSDEEEKAVDEVAIDHEAKGDDGAAEEDVAWEPDPIFLINPQVLSCSDERSIYEEGCLSIPDYYAEVERPASCQIQYLDRQGKLQVIDANDILATCVQHEIDHLEGILFIDHISKLKRDMVVKKFTKIARQTDKKPARSVIG